MRVLLCYNNCVGVGVGVGVAVSVVVGGIDSAATATIIIIIIITQTNCKHAFILIAGHTKALSPTSTPTAHS